MSIETIVEEVKAEAIKVVEEVKAEVAKIEPEVKKAIVTLTADEKLVLAEAELEYLKSTQEIQRLSKITETKVKEYNSALENFLVKYGLNKAEYVFDNVKRAFVAIEKKL